VLAINHFISHIVAVHYSFFLDFMTIILHSLCPIALYCILYSTNYHVVGRPEPCPGRATTPLTATADDVRHNNWWADGFFGIRDTRFEGKIIT